MEKTRGRKAYESRIRTLAKLGTRVCKGCGSDYLPVSFHQMYCNPKCRKVVNIRRFPQMICQHCRNKFQLNFNPIKKKNYSLLQTIKCPKCKKLASTYEF